MNDDDGSGTVTYLRPVINEAFPNGNSTPNTAYTVKQLVMLV